ncbi:kinase-like protein [Plenodomus tracheiphilus IPT5]|uniref:Kinase-like protein n=1 Tax=Plenodomus tracheiphilus IPT5 TaxID=1408161 RepID=A0A6A7B648_9PLEO|nr:kinase-like protein [Plenodomus tracheiphilus IPT5]
MPGDSQVSRFLGTDIAIANDLKHAPADPGTHERRKKNLFVIVRQLGEGGDGVVEQWSHLPTNTQIAVKKPHNNHGSRQAVLHEIGNLNMLGAHDHIVHMIAFETALLSPVLCLQLCEFGNLLDYRANWCDQEEAERRPDWPSDITIWKLYKDMSLALDFIHNKQQVSYVHNDLKPENILVSAPAHWEPESGIPKEPIFKITDFARLMAYPPAPSGHYNRYCGTSEYAPPLIERNFPIHPAVDIWGLGATIQTFKTGRSSTQSRQAYVRDMVAQGKPHPALFDDEAWHNADVRWQRSVVYRPLNVSAATLESEYDLIGTKDNYTPSSNTLERAYRVLWHSEASERINSAALVKHVVPRIDRTITILESSMRAAQLLEAASKLREKVSVEQVQRLMHPV